MLLAWRTGLSRSRSYTAPLRPATLFPVCCNPTLFVVCHCTSDARVAWVALGDRWGCRVCAALFSVGVALFSQRDIVLHVSMRVAVH